MEEQLGITLKQCNLPFRSGPMTSTLDEVLKEQGILTQAYHGRSFVGNHFHKYLKVFNHICDGVVRKTIETTDDGECHAVANDICRDFKTLNSLYSVVHTQLLHTQSDRKRV